MTKFNAIKHLLHQTGLPVDQVKLCVEIIDYLETLPSLQAQFLTIPDISGALISEKTLSEIMSALSVLSSIQSAPLSTHAYIEETEGDVVEIPDEDFAHLMHEGELAHPILGDFIENPMDRVRLFYRVREAQ